MVTEKLITDIRKAMKQRAAKAEIRQGLIEEPHCPICGKEIYPSAAPDVEYILTKRGTEILAHTKCIRKEWGHGPSKD